MKKLFLPLLAGICLAVVGSASAAGSVPALPQLTLALNGKTVKVGGTLRSGAVEVVTTTSGERDGQPVLFRLDPGVSYAEFGRIAGRADNDPNNVIPFGSIVFSTDAPQGVTRAATVLQPGRYVALDPPQDEKSHGVPPHTFFTVKPAAHPAALPAAQATIHTIEFAFRGPDTLRPGEVVRFENDGFLVHMVVAVQARSRASAQQIEKLLEAGKDNQAEHLAVDGYGLMGTVTNGGVVQMPLQVKPGWYVLACFMDTQDHREHTQLGMVRLLQVTG